MMYASRDKAVRVAEDEGRAMGRTATGVRGMKLADGERVVAMVVVEGENDILTASENGFGKRTAVAEYPRKGRGTMGVIALQTSERNGALVGALQLSGKHDVMLISDQGTMVRTRAAEIAQVGRNMQGVTLMRVAAGERLIALEAIEAIEGEASGDEPLPEAASGDVGDAAT